MSLTVTDRRGNARDMLANLSNADLNIGLNVLRATHVAWGGRMKAHAAIEPPSLRAERQKRLDALVEAADVVAEFLYSGRRSGRTVSVPIAPEDPAQSQQTQRLSDVVQLESVTGAAHVKVSAGNTPPLPLGHGTESSVSFWHGKSKLQGPAEGQSTERQYCPDWASTPRGRILTRPSNRSSRR